MCPQMPWRIGEILPKCITRSDGSRLNEQEDERWIGLTKGVSNGYAEQDID